MMSWMDQMGQQQVPQMAVVGTVAGRDAWEMEAVVHPSGIGHQIVPQRLLLVVVADVGRPSLPPHSLEDEWSRQRQRIGSLVRIDAAEISNGMTF
jgi:hypothetical protein